MKRWKYILLSNFIVLIIVFSNCQNHPMSVSAYSDNYSHNKETKIISFLKNIDIMLDETGGYLDIEHPDSFIATSHLIFTLSMLEEIDRLTGDDREYVLSKTRNLVQFIRENFIDPFHHDSRGITNFYNLDLEEESYSRAIKKASDQILLITVLSKLIKVLDPDDSSLTDYGILINQTIDFVKEYLDDTEFFGYYRKVTPIGQDSYAVDSTKSIEDLSWIILSMISLPDEYYNKLDPSGQKLIQLVDFINSNIQEEDGAITSFLSNDGSYNYDMYSLKDNALFALANIAIYKVTNNITNLSSATRIFNFLHTNFWDLGFQGYFEQVDNTRDISVRSKSSSGNILVTQLLYELLTVYPDNKTYSDTYSRLKTFIQDNFEEYTGLVKTSTNRRGVTVIGRSFKSNTINYWSLVSQPHITDIQFNKEIPIGLNFEGSLTISNPYNQTYSLILESEAFSDDILISEESIKVSLPLNNNISTGVHSVSLTLNFRNTEISKYEFAITISTGAITLPILLILGFGTIMIIILFLMRPELLNILVSETKRELEDREEFKINVKSEKAVNTEKNLNK